MRYVWLLAPTLLFATQAHAFEHWTCELLVYVKVRSCLPSEDPKCKLVEALDPEQLAARTVSEKFTLDYAFQPRSPGSVEFYLVNRDISGWVYSDQFTLMETHNGEEYVGTGKPTATFEVKTISPDETTVARLLEVKRSSTTTETYTCVKKN